MIRSNIKNSSVNHSVVIKHPPSMASEKKKLKKNRSLPFKTLICKKEDIAVSKKNIHGLLQSNIQSLMNYELHAI